jgi:hypothetical protein
MTQNLSGQSTCDLCHQPFNSEQELQEHQKNAHSQPKQGNNQPGSERTYQDYPEQDQRREKIA